MTENEAIKELKEDISLYDNEITRLDTSIGTPDRNLIDALEMAIQALEEIQQYREIGTVDECREARNKQAPKNPTYEGDGYAPDGTFVWDEWLCPCCRGRYEVDYDDYDYCPNCGQKLDWSDEE